MQQYNVLNTFTGMGQSEWGDKTEFQFQCQCNMNSTDFCCESAFWLHIYNTNLHTYTCTQCTHTHTHEMHYIENCDRIAFALYFRSAKDCAYYVHYLCVWCRLQQQSTSSIFAKSMQWNVLFGAQPHRLLPIYHAKLLTVHLHVQ